ncbi:MAG TPA: hypothetical protein VHU42_08205 [Rhodopila sp.]|jgi:hypothetical protein|nr:hypothetical protein [Rhodopila sp.]
MASNTGFPTDPVVDANGNLTPAWRAFLLALYNRTGSAVGVSTGTISGQLATEVSARTAADTTLAGSIASEQAARIAADGAEATARASADAALGARITALATSQGTNGMTLARFWFGPA